MRTGSSVGASGVDAFEIMRWWGGCEQMNALHGTVYNGPKLKPLVRDLKLIDGEKQEQPDEH